MDGAVTISTAGNTGSTGTRVPNKPPVNNDAINFLHWLDTTMMATGKVEEARGEELGSMSAKPFAADADIKTFMTKTAATTGPM